MTNVKVIFVEDSEDDLILAERTLIKSGIKPDYIRIETREDLTAALQDKHWQLVICDHHMPNFSAPEALETLKSSGCDLPFIVCSGTIEEGLAEELVNKGAAGYVNKQDLNGLVKAVNLLIES